jgi:hypothetical protein
LQPSTSGTAAIPEHEGNFIEINNLEKIKIS